MIRIKPLFYYAGGKVKLLKTYTPFFQGLRPQHCVDYFGGSGSMSLWFHQLYPEAKLFLNEKDRALYGLWQCIKEQYEALLEEIQVLEANYAQCHGDKDTQKLWYYNDLRDYSYNETQVPPDEWFEAHEEELDRTFEENFGCSPTGLSEEQVREILRMHGELYFTEEEEQETFGTNTPFEHACYLFLRRLSFSGMNQRNHVGQYTSGAGIRPATQSYCHPEALADFKAMLEHTEILNKDYKDLDLRLPQSLHYFDPPYVGSDEHFYCSRFGWEQTEEMCDYIQRLAEQSTVFMSNDDHPRLKKLMKGFSWDSFLGTGGMQRKRKKEPVREILFYKIHPSIAG